MKCLNCKCEASKDLDLFIYQLTNKKGQINKRQSYICRICLNGGHLSKHKEKYGHYVKTKDIPKKKKNEYIIYYKYK